MLATPTTAGPVAKFVEKPPNDSAMVLCAGQKRSGIHCTTSLSTHWNLPVMAGDDLTSIARSAARRSVTGAPNVTVTGCATPTTSLGAGKTDAIAPFTGWFATVIRTLE